MIPQALLFFLLHGKPQASPQAHRVVASAPAKPAPYGIYDSAQADAIPHGVNQGIYSNGSWPGTAKNLKGHPRTLWFDVTGGNPHADVLDIEDHDAGWWQAGPWAAAAHKDHPGKPVIIYTAVATWAAAEKSVAQYHVKVKWWVASPSGYPHLVPGSSATQWFWGDRFGKPYDISETAPNFWKA